MKKILTMVLAGVVGLAGMAATPMNTQLDPRGLLVVRGVTWPEGDWWAAANLVVFGPHGEYRGQDQEGGAIKMRDLGEGNADFDGPLNVGGGAKMKVHEEIRNLEGALSGQKKITWRITADGREKLNASRGYVFFPLKYSAFDCGTMVFPDGKEDSMLAGPDIPMQQDARYRFISKDGTTTFEIWGMKAEKVALVCEESKKQFEIRLSFANIADAKESEIGFSYVAMGDAKFAVKIPPPRTIITNGAEWVEFPFATQVKEGSILDFSSQFQNDIPAGKFGRLVSDGKGHLVREKDGKIVRLVGANLNYGANFLDKALADGTAKDFRKMGYNAVRYHHIDVTIQRGDWNSWKSCDIDPKKLDALDYLFAAMKKEGMYSTTDLYQMRRVGKGEIEGIDEALDFGHLKGYLPYHKPAFECWKKFAKELLEHVNPYTGLAWKDAPSLVFICPVNEDSICSITPRDEKSKVWPFFKKAYDEWRGDKPDTEQARLEFMTRAKMKFDREVEEFLKNEVGYKGMLTSENWWDLKSQTLIRDGLDIVDNHGYADHPEGWPQQKWNQTSNTKPNNMAYQEPVMKAPSRIFGKPMAITEWNFCAPNKFRAESGPTMGAYASLQDWAALYRFAWSHEVGRIKEASPVKHFDIVNDPLNQLSERIGVLMFRRGDVKRAKETICYAVDADEGTRDGRGDMWSKGLFPLNFVMQGFVHRIGSQAVSKSRPVRGKFTKVTAGKELDAKVLAGNAFAPLAEFPNTMTSNDDLVSDTGEIDISRAGRLTVASAKTEAIVAYPKGDKKGEDGFKAGGLAIPPVEKFQVVSASAMDGKDLRNSKKILFFHLTNVYNTDMLFDGGGMHHIQQTGDLPYLVQTAATDVSFASAVKGLHLYAVRYDGTRIREIPMKYEDGVYRFRLSIDQSAEAVMAYEMTDAAPRNKPRKNTERNGKTRNH